VATARTALAFDDAGLAKLAHHCLEELGRGSRSASHVGGPGERGGRRVEREVEGCPEGIVGSEAEAHG
jgi:hypothetical protein